MGLWLKIKSIYDVILGDSRYAVESSNSDFDDMIRYPSLDKGVPFKSVDAVIKSQQELINKLQLQIGVEDEIWDSMVLPTIRNYASFVHLLPASEAHHHRGLGGLFRHGLEVAYWSLIRQEGVVLGERDLTPTEKHERVVVWRLASFVAGLCHDLGKPVLDINVHTKDDEWNPHGEFLTDFLKSKKADRYYVVWRPNRDKSEHEVFAGLAVKQIVAPELWKLLLGQSRHRNSDITVEILKAITGMVSREKTLPDLVKKADQESVARDLANIGKSAPLVALNNSTALPIDLFVINAITDILLAKTFAINEPGAPVWSLKTLDGDHVIALNWTRFFEEVKAKLHKNGVKGVPSDKDRVAELLVERNLAKGNEQGGLYPQLRPEPIAAAAKKGLWLLCFDPDALYSNRPAPEPVDCVEIEVDSVIKTETVSTQEPSEKEPSNEGSLAAPVEAVPSAASTSSVYDDWNAPAQLSSDWGDENEQTGIKAEQEAVSNVVDDEPETENELKQVFDELQFSKLNTSNIISRNASSITVKHPSAVKQIAEINAMEAKDVLARLKEIDALVNPLSPIIKDGNVNAVKLSFKNEWFFQDGSAGSAKKQVKPKHEKEQVEAVPEVAESQSVVAEQNLSQTKAVENKSLAGIDKAVIFDMLIDEMKSGVLSGRVVFDEKEAGVMTMRKTVKKMQEEAGITLSEIQKEPRLKFAKGKYVLSEKE